MLEMPLPAHSPRVLLALTATILPDQAPHGRVSRCAGWAPRRAARCLSDRCHPGRRVDINKPRIRAALGALTALVVAPEGFTVSDFTTKVQAMTGQAGADYTFRQ